MSPYFCISEHFSSMAGQQGLIRSTCDVCVGGTIVNDIGHVAARKGVVLKAMHMRPRRKQQTRIRKKCRSGIFLSEMSK